jgi:release factor glutamine methyltransferase
MNSPEKSVTLEYWLVNARSATKDTNPNAPDLIARKVLKLSKPELISKSKELKLSKKNYLKLNNLLGKVLSGRPLSAALKHTQFHNIKLKINSKVLSPRAETEELVEYAIKNIPNSATVLDVGTGTGAIGLSLAKARPDLRLILTDLQSSTLNLAKLNARKNRISSAEFKQSNLIKFFDQKDIQNSFFLANLPYVNKNWPKVEMSKLKFEPHSALFAKKDGLQIIYNLLDEIHSKNLLSKNNWILLEHDPKQFTNLTKYCSSLNYSTQKISDFITLVKLK